MNNNLYQKHHGLPGVGIFGQTGFAGENGASIYFGFVKDFFDGLQIQHDARIKLAKRKPSADTKNDEYIEMTDRLLSGIEVSTAQTIRSGIFQNLYKANGLYYSGSVYDEKTANLFLNDTDLSKYLIKKYDIDTKPWLMAQMVGSLNSTDPNVAAIINNASTFAEINVSNVKIPSANSTIEYIDTYMYEQDAATGEFISQVNTTIDQLHITYESEDVLNRAEQSNDFSVSTYLDRNAQEISSVTSPYSYLKEIMKVNGVTYTTDSNDLYAVAYMNSEDNSGITYYYHNAEYLQPNDVSLYTKNAIELQDSVIFDDEFTIDSNGHKLTYYGIADSSIQYPEDASAFSSEETRQFIMDTIAGTSLYKSQNNLDEAVDKYINRVTMTLSNNPLIKENQDKLEIRWIADEDNIITIPTTLLSSYKAGDIIYFYTDEQEYMTSNKIAYMVVMTKELEGCGFDTFIASAIKVDPFEIKYLEEKNNRVRSTNKVITLNQAKNLKNKDVRDINRFSYNSINNIISSYSNSNIILADAYNKTHSGYMQFNAIAENKEYKLTVKANNDEGVINANVLKLDTLLVPNKSYTSNVESYRSVYDPFVIFDENKFIQPITESDLYEYVTENNVYIGFTLNATDYIRTKFANIDDYIYGYELYNNIGQLIQTESSSSDNILGFINNLYPGKDMNKLKYSTYSVVQEFQIIHNNNEQVLDWDGLTYVYKKMMLIDKYIYFVFDSNVVPSNSPYNESNTIKILLSAEDTKYYTFASEYIDGKYYYHESGKTIKSIDAVYQNQAYISTDKEIVTKNVEPFQSSFFINVFVANKHNGVKYYSKMSIINYLISITDGFLSDYSCHVVDDGEDLIKTNESDEIQFRSSNVSPGSNANGKLEIVSEQFDTTIQNIYINHQLLKQEGSIYRNSWFTLVASEITPNYCNLTFSTKSNIPNMFSADGDQVESVNKYMVGLCDAYDDAGILKDVEAPLFKYLNSGKKLPSTTDRYILVSVEYTTADDPDNVQVANYNILQPGFKDTRDIPDISLNIHTSMEDVEKYNTFENGVLCNQFVTYMDINVSNFDEAWGKYMDNSTNISLDLEFNNISSDLDWTAKHTIQNALTTRNTIKIIGDDAFDAAGKLSNEPINNYVALNTAFVNPTDNSSIQYDYIDVSSSLKLQTTKSIASELDYESTYINGKQYILCDSSIMAASVQPNLIYKGINDYITIKMSGITPQMLHDCSTYRVKIEYEMGNPLISSLYLRFALKKVVIHYDTYIDGQLSNKTFTAEVPAVKTQGSNNYIYKYSTNNIETYKYISNTLNVNTNPIEYVICPIENERNITDIQGTIMKVGNTNQVTKKVAFHDASVYDLNNLMIQDNSAIRENLYYDWSSFRTKGAYFQDNIANIEIAYKDLDIEHMDNVHKGLIQSLDPDLFADRNVNDLIDGQKYINMVYNSSIMTPRLRDGKYTFYYNGDDYECNRYNQVSANCPIYATDNNKISVRSQETVDSMDIWNFEYISGKPNPQDKVFTGNINRYGNGYMFLSNDADQGQYESMEMLPLSEIKASNDQYIYNNATYGDIEHDPANIYEPEFSRYYRTFLYDIDFAYPQYTMNNNVKMYQIVSDFDYLIKYMKTNGMIMTGSTYDNRYEELSQKYGNDNINSDMVPYSLLFDISPRIAYNTEYDTINVLMLRRPAIGKDHDNMNNIQDCYTLQQRYFELSDNQEIKKLKFPYNLIK